MTSKITPDAVRAALEAGEPRCTKCGHKRSEHHYRHLFQPSHTTTIETMAPDLATAYLALAEENERLRKRVEAADALARAALLCHPYVEELNCGEELRDALAAYRATEERG